MKFLVHSESKGGKRVRNALAFAEQYSNLLKIQDFEHTCTIIVRDNFKNAGQLFYEGDHSFLVLKAGQVSVMMQTLAHEMVHLKQFVTGELGHTKGGNLKWKGKVYTEKKMPNWVNRPWEIEAMQKEVILHYYAQTVLA